MLPLQLVILQAPLRSAMAETGREIGDSELVAEVVFSSLPPSIREARAFKTLLPDGWLYEYGEPIERIAGGIRVGGTPQYPPVSKLYLAVRTAIERLPSADLQTWIARLGDRAKHCDWREEMLAVHRVDPDIRLQYEVQGMCERNQVADWLVTPESGPPILFDVKNRVSDTVQFLEQAVPQLLQGKEPEIAAIDVAPLFRSIEKKFPERDASSVCQGAWIRCGIKHVGLRTQFEALSARRVHFVIISNGPDFEEVLARSSSVGDHVAEVLGIQRSK